MKRLYSFLVAILILSEIALPVYPETGSALPYLVYETEKKSPLTALFINLVIPGLGNMFAGGYVSGVLLMSANIYANTQYAEAVANYDEQKYYSAYYLSAGVFVLSIVTAFTDTNAYNNKLKKRIGLSGKILPPVSSPGIIFALEKDF